MLVVGLMVLSSILVMMYGWGLQPRSWGWIIGVGFFVQVALRGLSDAVSKKD